MKTADMHRSKIYISEKFSYNKKSWIFLFAYTSMFIVTRMHASAFHVIQQPERITISESFIVNGSASICPGSEPVYTIPNATQSFQWELLDGSGSSVYGPQTSASPFTLPASVTQSLPPGSYSLKADDLSSSFCNQTVNFNIVVNPAPPAPLGITGEIQVCPGYHEYSALLNNASNIAEWTATNGTPATVVGSPVTIDWLAVAGTYQLEVRERDALTGCLSLPYSISPQKIVAVLPNCLLEDVNGNISCASTSCMNVRRAYFFDNWNTRNLENVEAEITPAGAGSVELQYDDPANNRYVLEIQWNNYSGPATIRVKANTCGVQSMLLLVPVTIAGGQAISISNPAPVTACENELINFNITPPPLYPGVSQLEWNWGDNHSSTGPYNTIGFNHFYELSGTNVFPVTVRLYDNGCFSTTSTTVTINPMPTVAINASATDLCNPPVTLTAVAPGGSSWQWSTGSTAPSIQVSTIGVYTLTVTGANTCQNSASVDINPCPTPCTPTNFQISASVQADPVCGMATITVSGIGHAFDYYIIKWGYNDLATTVPAGTPFPYVKQAGYPMAGTYQVCVSAFWHDPATGIDYCDELCLPLTIEAAGYLYNGISCPTTVNAQGLPLYDISVIANLTTTGNMTYTWQWNGNTVGGNQPYTPSLAMDYSIANDVMLNVTNASGFSCYLEKHFAVGSLPQPPTANFKIENGPPLPPFCEKQSVVHFNFTGSYSTLNHAVWNFGDGSFLIPVYPFPATTIDAPKVYDGLLYQIVNLTTYDNYGCSYTHNENITINQNNLNGVVSPPKGVFCPGSSINLTYQPFPSSDIPTSYEWSFGQTTQTTTINTYSASQTGRYACKAIDAVSGCYLEIFKAADIGKANVPNPIIRGKDSYCEGENMYFNGNTGVANVTYNWTLDPMLTLDNSQTPQPYELFVQPAPAGSYDVQLDITTPASGIVPSCVVTVIKTITINPLPAKPIILSNPSPACEGSKTTLEVTNLQSPQQQLTWSNGSSQNPVTVFNAGGYEATITDINTGCSNTSNRIQVIPSPDLSWLITGCIDLCSNSNNPVIIYGSPSTLQYEKWEWYVNNNSVMYGANSNVPDLNLNNTISNPLPPGVYVIQVSVTNLGCQIMSDPIYVTIRSCPCKIDYVKENNYECLGTDINGISYYKFNFTIQFGGGFIPNGIFNLSSNNGNPVTVWSYTINNSQVSMEGILSTPPNGSPSKNLCWHSKVTNQWFQKCSRTILSGF